MIDLTSLNGFDTYEKIGNMTEKVNRFNDIFCFNSVCAHILNSACSNLSGNMRQVFCSPIAMVYGILYKIIHQNTGTGSDKNILAVFLDNINTAYSRMKNRSLKIFVKKDVTAGSYVEKRSFCTT